MSTDPRVDAYIDALPAWQQDVCREVRSLVHAADPEVEETIKRRDRPYFVLQGNVCALLAAKRHVCVFLYDGAIVPDPEGIITGGHDNSTARQISIHEGEPINGPALRAMFERIIANNRAGGWRKIKAAGRGIAVPEISLLAVAAATLAAFLIGGIYYGPLGSRLPSAGEEPPAPWTYAAELARCLVLAVASSAWPRRAGSTAPPAASSWASRSGSGSRSCCGRARSSTSARPCLWRRSTPATGSPSYSRSACSPRSCRELVNRNQEAAGTGAARGGTPGSPAPPVRSAPHRSCGDPCGRRGRMTGRPTPAAWATRSASR